MTYDDDTPTTQSQNFLTHIESQTNALTTLDPSVDEHALLTAQTHLLNDIFVNIAAAHLSSPPDYAKHYREPQREWLALALKAQKQCTHAIKAKAAARYMDSLIPNAPPAPSIKNDERTEG